MKIAVNTRLLLKNKMEGIGWFTCEALSRITKNHPEVEFLFFFDRKYDPSFVFSNNVTPIIISPPARHPVLYYIWFHYAIPAALRKHKPDLFLSPDGYLPLRCNTPTLTVFHDLNFEHYPQDLPFFERRYYKTFFPQYARRATRIATVSEYSASDIVKQYGVPPEKIDVVYNGANPAFKPLDKEGQAATRASFTHGKPYFLFVGALHPRKNLVNLFKAFELFKKQSARPHALALAGNQSGGPRKSGKLMSKRTPYRDEVLLLGRQPADRLVELFASAEALTYISYFEGFGIPIVEAFRAGVPVITSNITSMPEVAGDAALKADPFSPGAYQQSHGTNRPDPTLRNTLIEKGKERAALFTWDKTAENLWKSIIKTIKS
ncbi:MAG: glycosyltransferase family 1 protein [Bacteroidales bacterium]|nr:glycosyltransferase family 1 protein [Bacteroidales bacterium]